MGGHAELTPHGEILFAICKEKTVVSEYFIPEHVLAHIYSGSVSIAEAEKTHTFNEGDTLLLTKNLLAKFINYPSGSAPFKSMLIIFKQHTLQEFYTGKEVKQIKKTSIGRVRSFVRHPSFNSLFNSLLPYYEFNHALPEELITLKFREAITILRKIDSSSDEIGRASC